MKNVVSFGSARGGLPLSGLIILSLVFLTSFAIQTIITVKLSSIGAFDYYNIFYDSDASKGLVVRAHGWGIDDRAVIRVPNYVHPLNNYITMPIIRVAAIPISLLNADWTQAQVREWLALLVSPACVALSSLVLGVSLLWIGLSVGSAVGAACLYSASFSTLMFGAIPDHFSMGGLSIALLLAWLASWLARSDPISRSGYAIWAFLAAFACGVTITNVFVALEILIVALMRRRTIFDAIVRAGLATIGVTVGVVLCAFILGHIVMRFGLGRGRTETDSDFLVGMVTNYSAFDPQSLISKGLEFVFHSVQAVINLGLERQPHYRESDPDTIVPLGASAWSVADGSIAVILIGLVVAGIYFGLRARTNETVKSFAFACAFVLLGNIVLHSVYGRVEFLYSQHWLFAMVFFIVLAVMHLRHVVVPRAQIAIAVILTVAVVASDFHWVREAIAMTDSIVNDFRNQTTPTIE